jgi:hypothetical protein
MSAMTAEDTTPESPAPKGNRRRVWYFASIALTGGFLLYGLAITIGQARETARKAQCRNTLKQIGLALSNYREIFGCFPPPYIADETGQPRHSWRVLLRPFIDASHFYSRYRFDEPWNGPNNSELIAAEQGRFPWYHCPSHDNDDAFMTDYVAVVGPGTAWDVEHPVRMRDITDGPGNTLLVVEVVGSGIHWAEPRDLAIDQMAPTVNAKTGLGISSRHVGGAHGLMADGTVVFLSDKLSAASIRGLLTIKGGEKVAP